MEQEKCMFLVLVRSTERSAEQSTEYTLLLNYPKSRLGRGEGVKSGGYLMFRTHRQHCFSAPGLQPISLHFAQQWVDTLPAECIDYFVKPLAAVEERLTYCSLLVRYSLFFPQKL
jgi:hypothetical protein